MNDHSSHAPLPHRLVFGDAPAKSRLWRMPSVTSAPCPGFTSYFCLRSFLLGVSVYPTGTFSVLTAIKCSALFKCCAVPTDGRAPDLRPQQCVTASMHHRGNGRTPCKLPCVKATDACAIIARLAHMCVCVGGGGAFTPSTVSGEGGVSDAVGWGDGAAVGTISGADAGATSGGAASEQQLNKLSRWLHVVNITFW